jgi:hypothetical protein
MRVTAIADALKSNSKMISLQLSYNPFGEEYKFELEGIHAIVKSFELNSYLTSLCLCIDNIISEGVTAIAELIKKIHP